MTSLRYRIALAVFLLAGSMAAVLLWQVLVAQEKGAAAQQAAAEATVSDLLAEASRFAVVRSEYSDLQHLFEKVRREGQVRTAAVADGEGRVVASTDGTLLGKPLPPLRDGTDAGWVTRELVGAAGRQGLLALEFSRTGLRQAREQAQRRGAVVALLGASLLALLSVMLGTALTRRLTQLEQASRRIGEGEYATRTGLDGRDEFSALGRTLDAAAARVQLSMRELGASREEYRLLLETLPHGVQETDASGLITYSNRAHHRILGYPEGELVGKRIFELQATPEERGELERDLARLASERPPPAPYLTRSRRKDGSLVDLQIDWDYRLDSSGRLTGFISVITDVTERRRAEARISHLNRIHALLVGVNQAMVRFRDRQDLMDEICRVAVEVGRFRLAWIGLADRKANRVRIAARCGQAGEYLDSLDIPLEGGPEAQGPTATAIRESAPSFCNDIQGDPQMAPWRDTALAHGYRSSASLPIRVLGETTGALNLYSAEPGFFSAGEVRLLQDLAADVALAFEHLERGAALRRSEERYRMVVENASEAIFIAQDGRLKFPNAALERLLERPAGEIGARPFTEFIHPDDRELVATRYRGRLAGQDLPSAYEFRVTTASGRTRWVQIGTVRIEWEGRPATLNFLSDVSERKGLEAQLLHAQKMEAVGRLAGGVAHDFNNLLAAIIGFGSAALAELPEGQTVRGDVEQMLAAAQRAAELTRSLLAFSRLQASNPQPISLDAVIAKLELLLRRVIGEDVELRTEPGAPGATVLADRGQVEQLLVNLATNARDAMPGGGRLTLSTRLGRIDESSSGSTATASQGSTCCSRSETPGWAWTRRPGAAPSSPSSPPRRWGRALAWGWPRSTGS